MVSAIAKFALVSGLIFACLAINKTYSFASKKEIQVSETTKEKQKTTLNAIKKLKRINILAEGEIHPETLKPLISYTYQNGKVSVDINDEQIETTLKPFIKQELQKVFLKRGWNFAELEGRIYYEIEKENLELYVIWKNNIYSKNYTHYDRLSMQFN